MFRLTGCSECTPQLLESNWNFFFKQTRKRKVSFQLRFHFFINFLLNFPAPFLSRFLPFSVWKKRVIWRTFSHVLWQCINQVQPMLLRVNQCICMNVPSIGGNQMRLYVSVCISICICVSISVSVFLHRRTGRDVRDVTLTSLESGRKWRRAQNIIKMIM